MILGAFQGADTILFAISVLVALAGALGVSYTIFRSASEQRLRELDKRIIENQTALLLQSETEVAKERQLRLAAELSSNTYRDSLTQKAAVDHLAEVLVKEEALRATEHVRQGEVHDMMVVLLKDIVAQLKGARGTIS